MQPLAPLIRDLAIMLGVASIVILSLQKIRQPVVLGYLVAGILIGPYIGANLITEKAEIQVLSDLGVIFLMFFLGLEFSFHKLARTGFSAAITGVFEVSLMILFGFLTGKFLGWSFYNCLFLGAALANSSTTIIIKTMDELNLMKKRFTEFVFEILIVEDLIAILLLVTLPIIVTTQELSPLEMGEMTIKLILVVSGWFIGGYFLIPTLLRRIMIYANEETITVVSIGLCLFLASLAAKLHYSAPLGAFIMGSILAETPIIHRAKAAIKPIRDIFAAVFFIAVGMLIDPSIIIQQWKSVLLISMVLIFGKLFATTLGTFLTGQSLNTSLRVGFSMAQVGEFSFIIMHLGILLHVTDHSLRPIIVAVAGISIFTAPFLIRFSKYLVEKLDSRLSDKTKYFLESYSNTIYRIFFPSSQVNLRKKIIPRLIINSIVVAIIFELVYKFLFPWKTQFITDIWLNKTLCWMEALLLSSPFLWGMFSTFKMLAPLEKKIHLSVFIIWLLTIIEIAILSFLYFHTWPVVIILTFVLLLFLAISYRRLEKAYAWFEHHFTENIKNKDKRQIKYDELAPWDTYLVELDVNEESIFVGKNLKSCEISEQFGINLVAIQRGKKIIFAPKEKEKIFPQDKLIILGTEEQIEKFKEKIEPVIKQYEPIELLDNFSLKPFLLQKNSPFIGKTIEQIKLESRIHGLVVGLERAGRRILNPSLKTSLQAKDLLFLVGETKYLDSLREDET